MTVRFRIRTSGGQELSFATREMFEDFVRSGDLSPDDLVYDREIGSWSPARTHPMVLDIGYEEEAEGAHGDEREGGTEGAESSEADTGDSVDADSEAVSGDAPMDELKLELAPTEELSAEEAKRAFVEKLEAERLSDLDVMPSMRDSLEGFTMEDAGSFGEMLQDEPPPAEPEPPPAPTPRRRPERTARFEAPGPVEERGAPRARPTPPKRKRKKKGGGRRAVGMLLLLPVLAGAGYAGWVFLQGMDAGPPVEQGDVPDDPVGQPVDVEPTPPPGPEPVIPATELAVRERARERYLTSTQTDLRDLEPIPEAWPEGPYLSEPSSFPEVVDIWQSYLTTIRAVRATDEERYGSALEAALDDAAIEGEARATRLEAAMSDFDRTAPLRQAHFDRVEALATAAIQSHDALLEAEGLILFDATGSTGREEGIGAGTSARDGESQLLLDQVLELLEGTLDADGEGPGSGENVREWVWDGFLDAATR